MIVNMTWGPANSEQGTGSLAAALAKWGAEPNLAGFWIADDCSRPGKREADWTVFLRTERPDLAAIICQDFPNGAGLRNVGATVKWDMVFSYKDATEAEVDAVAVQSRECGLTPWIIVNLDFAKPVWGNGSRAVRDRRGFAWTRLTMLYAKKQGVRGYWYFTDDAELFDGKHDLSLIAKLNRELCAQKEAS